ncbi:Cysteine-rich receptor-like protein kinase 10 [Panicum miliaceum]|uniref:Cysteine-rich receptor-like protein kinase 10 n=1 Tax=Panicum miliaceum TaxID=4540 RepID=A0A3L6THP1_PANMI|nr:Cysteine-rich receptor-like protein kinase 10 [Panicum miliaceum]
MNTVAGVLLLFLLGGLTPSPAAADVCDNIKQVAATLPKNTSSSPLHFATATFGQAPDVVYALALCRGDVLNDTACGDCVANTFAKVLGQTSPPPQQCFKAAYYYGGPCMLVYSVDDILARSNNNTTVPNGDDEPFTLSLWNVMNFTGDADDVRRIVGLKQELLLKTVQMAAGAEPRRFATGVMDSGTTFPPVYSLAQCTPDLSAGDCQACLRRLLGMVNSTMALRMGAQIHVIRCYFRYETYLFYDSKPMLRVGPSSPPAPAPTPATVAKHKRRMSKLWAIPIVVVPLAAAAFLCFLFYSPWFRRYRKGRAMRLQAGSRRTQDLQGDEELVWDGKNSEFSVFDFEQVLVATDHFSEENKLGQGGFGAVYKGQFPEGLQIAVKRLASQSGQGFTEFKNEVQLIAKLQHRNLMKVEELCWIDFGLAKIFSSNNTERNTTQRVVGTYGYMAPEYASEGIFSIKSDVFSFGVLVLEILSGKRNSGSQQCGGFINLIGYAWQLWAEERWTELVDASLFPKSHSADMMRCINIALLCVQENADDRPTMADVVSMLSSETTTILAEPKRPAYFNVRVGDEEGFTTATQSCSINYMTISITTPR